MSKSNGVCLQLKTHKEKGWFYEQYYLGELDKDNRKAGEGQHHWSGAKSLEWYTGHFSRDTMHGDGEYRWRYEGPKNDSVTYEGYFYCNRMHGYGTMSYSDGRTFNGVYFNNVRWGPGVQSHAGVHDDVGLWRGSQLVRLAWRPANASIVPDFMSTNVGRSIVEAHRVMLTTEVNTVGKRNNALELLKQCGADPRVAVEKWSKVYSKHCTDLTSPLCHVEGFDRDYYKGPIYTLQEVDSIPEHNNEEDEGALKNIDTYFAWNNNIMIIKMMKHSFKHESQRCKAGIDLKSILSGPRRHFKSPGNHEIDCRTLLMASYLGHIEEVARLVNESNVHPDISDVLGNSAIMYATCGVQSDCIHFLVEAGAHVDFCNDCCCTPLGIALMRYVCTRNDVLPSGMLQALLPPPQIPVSPQVTAEPKVFEWNIIREQYPNTPGTLTKSPSKTARNMSSKKIKSLQSIKDQPMSKRKTDVGYPKPLDTICDSEESISKDKSNYNNINREFSIKVTDIFSSVNGPIPVSYIFDINDMVREIETFEEDQKKPPDKNLKKTVSKTIKDTIKTSKEMIWHTNEKEEISVNSAEKHKTDTLTKIMSTILQLLSDGANPRLVRCPYPALLIAILCYSPDLIRHLVRYGADVNENYSQVLDYAPLDVAVSSSLNHENLETVRALLECGADARRRLVYKQEVKDPNATEIEIPGPSLLHAVLAKKTENEIEEYIRRQLLELLLEYNCNPTILYKGRSAIDVAMSKSIDILDIFIKNPKTDLNAIINESKQSVLVKMFTVPFFKSIASSERLQLFTNLLLFGADPLVKCQNCEDIYQNIFVFAIKTLNEMESSQSKPVSPPGKHDPKAAKKVEKPKKDEKLSTKSMGKMAVDDVADYRQAVELVTDCARLIFIRWLQAKFMKELIVTIEKYKHRHWSIISKECQGMKSFALWLSPQRCLEIWDILSDTKKKIYNDIRIIRHLLSIVIFMSWQNYGHIHNVLSDTTPTAPIKDAIEKDVNHFLHQHKTDKIMTSNIPTWKSSYVKPELVKNAKKFNNCFECMQPLNDDKILCSWCKLIYFCSYECIKLNVNRMNCHPCSDYLKIKYFPSPSNSIEQII